MVKKLLESKINRRVSKIIEDYLQNLEGKIRVKKVILFGSAAQGRIHHESDIDLIIISPDFKKMDFIKRLLLLTRLRRNMKKSVPMDILGYTKEEFEKLAKQSIILKEAKEKGKIIK